jgi:hypothetical protein
MDDIPLPSGCIYSRSIVSSDFEELFRKWILKIHPDSSKSESIVYGKSYGETRGKIPHLLTLLRSTIHSSLNTPSNFNQAVVTFFDHRECLVPRIDSGDYGDEEVMFFFLESDKEGVYVQLNPFHDSRNLKAPIEKSYRFNPSSNTSLLLSGEARKDYSISIGRQYSSDPKPISSAVTVITFRQVLNTEVPTNVIHYRDEEQTDFLTGESKIVSRPYVVGVGGMYRLFEIPEKIFRVRYHLFYETSTYSRGNSYTYSVNVPNVGLAITNSCNGYGSGTSHSYIVSQLYFNKKKEVSSFDVYYVLAYDQLTQTAYVSNKIYTVHQSGDKEGTWRFGKQKDRISYISFGRISPNDPGFMK